MSKPRRTGQDRGIYGTRRERIARVRSELVHAAGEVHRNLNCCVTSFWLNPTEALELERDAIREEPGTLGFESLDLVRSGSVRIPRSLRRRWAEAMG